MNLLMIPACCPHPALVVRRRTTIRSAEARSQARRPASILDNAFYVDVGSDSVLPRLELKSVALQALDSQVRLDTLVLATHLAADPGRCLIDLEEAELAADPADRDETGDGAARSLVPAPE